MSKESYIAESEALNKLFNNMTQRKVDAAEKEKLKKEENKGEQVEAKKPLQAAPTTSRPIHSEYLEKKKKEEEEAKRIEEARRAKMRKQIEKGRRKRKNVSQIFSVLPLRKSRNRNQIPPSSLQQRMNP